MEGAAWEPRGGCPGVPGVAVPVVPAQGRAAGPVPGLRGAGGGRDPPAAPRRPVGRAGPGRGRRRGGGSARRGRERPDRERTAGPGRHRSAASCPRRVGTGAPEGGERGRG